MKVETKTRNNTAKSPQKLQKDCRKIKILNKYGLLVYSKQRFITCNVASSGAKAEFPFHLDSKCLQT